MRGAGPKDETACLTLLFAEKCFDWVEADERGPTGILTWASSLAPAFPGRGRVAGRALVAVTVAQPSRIRTGFPDMRPRALAELAPPVSKNGLVYTYRRSLQARSPPGDA